MNTQAQRVQVWDPLVRIFHWLNAALVLLLIAIGLVILNGKLLGISGDGKILLKTLHAWVGYVFVINLSLRLFWAFFGSHYARWRQFLPLGRNYLGSVKDYLVAMRAGKPRHYLGHNPVGRIVISLFFLVLSMQAVTGLVLAGTDLYFPPFGSYFAEWVTEGDPERLQNLLPGDRTHVVEAAYTEMRAFREPVIALHVYGFYTLLFLIVLHIAGVVVTELVEKNGLVSAMINGEKNRHGPYVDEQLKAKKNGQ